MSARAILLSALLPLMAPLLVRGHEERRLLTLSQKLEHIWGRCDQWDQSYQGCSLTDNMCSDHISEGPEDADVEVTLEGLPASTGSNDFHLQWWAAYESPNVYNPLETLVNCSVYSNSNQAYPKYFDDRFNGGNLRVPGSGVATIRVRSPATYFVPPFLAVPHIHLRLCRGEASAEISSGAVLFGEQEQWVLSGTHFGGSGIQIQSIGPYNAIPNDAVAAENATNATANAAEEGPTAASPAASHYIAGINKQDVSKSTTLAATVTASTSAATVTTLTSMATVTTTSTATVTTTSTATVTTASTTTTMTPNSTAEVMIQAAKDAFLD